MWDILFKDAALVTMENRGIISKGYIAVKEGKIAELGEGDPPAVPGETSPRARRVFDCKGKVIFPGLVNTHVHSFQTLMKGLGADREMIEWLNAAVMPFVTKLEGEDIYAGAALSGLESLKSGVTTVTDYQYVNTSPGFAESAIKGFRDVGAGLVYARGCADTGREFGIEDGEIQDRKTIEKELVQLVEKHHNKGIRIMAAPAALWTCTEKLLSSVREISDTYGLGVTIHMGETPFDSEATKKIHGCGEIEACEKTGLMNKRLLMVHCVTYREQEIEAASRGGAAVSYNPVSNMYLASGAAAVPDMLKAGLTVGLGTDGAASNNTNNMLETLKSGVLLAKVHYRDPTILSAYQTLEMATIGGARSLGIGEETGSLAEGKKGDLFVFDPRRAPFSVPNHDPVACLVYSGSPQNIETVLVGGEIVLEDGKLTKTDESAVLDEAAERAEKLVGN